MTHRRILDAPILRAGLLAGALACFTGAALAQQAPRITSQPIALGDRLTIPSAALRETRSVDIYVPQAGSFEAARYPVIYVLDGDVGFLHTVSAVTSLMLVDLMPKAIVVGINNVDRTRDFLPKAAIRDTEFTTAGGIDAFLDFFERELIPFVESHYPAGGRRVILGHSFGGVTAVYALTNRPTLFQGYITMEPSLWWDRRAVVKRLIGSLSARPTPNIRLVTVERENEFGFRREWKDVVKALPPSSKGALIETKGESHNSMTFKGRYDALRMMFADSAWWRK